jgi:predicted RNase H-like HicB family nuclease
MYRISLQRACYRKVLIVLARAGNELRTVGVQPKPLNVVEAVDNLWANTMKTMNLTALLEREGDGFVSLWPELDVASQGNTVEESLANLKEAVDLFLERNPTEELQHRYRNEVFVTRFEAAYA